MNILKKLLGVIFLTFLFIGLSSTSISALYYGNDYGYRGDDYSYRGNDYGYDNSYRGNDYGYRGSYSPYGYGSYYDLGPSAGFDNFQRNSFRDDRFSLFQDSQAFNQFQNTGFNRQSLFGQGYLNNQFGNFNQQGNIRLSDGYDFDKGPCVSSFKKFNADGKDSDWTLTEEVCDNVQGNFFRNNLYANTVDNNVGFNYGNAGFNFDSTNSFANQRTNRNAFTNNLNSASRSDERVSQFTSFGKGTRLNFR